MTPDEHLYDHACQAAPPDEREITMSTDNTTNDGYGDGKDWAAKSAQMYGGGSSGGGNVADSDCTANPNG